MDKYGFVSEPHGNGRHLVSPATKDASGNVICHDLSGFLGSWPMRDGGAFFECVEGDTMDRQAMMAAQEHAQRKNDDPSSII